MKLICLILCLYLLFVIGCNNDAGSSGPKCNSFYECLPTNVHPGDTGCGGCFPDENGAEVCYELDEKLCEEYMNKYHCIKGACIGS